MKRVLSRVGARFSQRARLAHALALLAEGEAVEGFGHLSILAGAGMPEAQFRVGRAYLDGTGVPPSLVEGARWMRRAAEAGWVEARLVLGTLYLFGLPHEAGAAQGLRLTAETPGDSTPDPTAAAHWARLAAEAGSPDAQALYGYILANGPDELRDVAAAEDWFARAAAAGCAQGHLGLGLAWLRAATDEAGRARAAAA
ncbi:tetratricopeptide repeat protein, partial [Gluconacetobacter johannae]